MLILCLGRAGTINTTREIESGKVRENDGSAGSADA
jgi:hypothetical protein